MREEEEETRLLYAALRCPRQDVFEGKRIIITVIGCSLRHEKTSPMSPSRHSSIAQPVVRGTDGSEEY